MTVTQERETALEQVSTNNGRWIDDAFSRFATLDLPTTFTGEDIRHAMLKSGLPQPKHHNAWGALTMKLVRAESIKATGDFTNMKEKQSHARLTRLYSRDSQGGKLSSLVMDCKALVVTLEHARSSGRPYMSPERVIQQLKDAIRKAE